MTPTNYQRGRAFEYRTRDKLKKIGAQFVMRAAQSKGIADLVALWPREQRQPWLVQCKRDGRLPAAERDELCVVAFNTGALPVLAKTGPKGRGVVLVNLWTMEEISG